MLQVGYSPTFHWSLEAFSDCDASDIDVLSVFEDFFRSHGFAQELLGVLELLLYCASADLDFACFRLLLREACLSRLGGGDDSDGCCLVRFCWSFSSIASVSKLSGRTMRRSRIAGGSFIHASLMFCSPYGVLV